MTTVPAAVHRPSSAPPPAAHARPRPTVPPAGPGWYSSVMGTGILATLLGRETGLLPFLIVPAVALLVVGVGLLVGLTSAFLVRIARDRAALTSTITDASVVTAWGTVSMGVLSIGSAVLTVVPQLGTPAATHWAVPVDVVLWTAGTALGVVTAFGFGAVLIKRDVGHPIPAWGLPIVPPMVSATTGAALIPHVAAPLGHLALLAVTIACFWLSLFLGGLVFALAYHHHWTVGTLPIPASASAWIPLGVVGQSMAAAQSIAAQARSVLTPTMADAGQTLADVYGVVMVVVAVPVIGWALAMTIRGFRAPMPFSPAWWALTFPIGTLALGTRMLGQATGIGAVSIAGAVSIIVLACTWTLCATATLRAVWEHRRTAPEA